MAKEYSELDLEDATETGYYRGWNNAKKDSEPPEWEQKKQFLAELEGRRTLREALLE